MFPVPLKNLTQQFMRLPGIGPRQAARFVFYLLRNESEISSLLESLKLVQQNVTLCSNCFLPAQNSHCSICASGKRDKNTICVVEKESDALNLEKVGQFQGHYFVLGGFIDPLERESIARERLCIFVQKLHAVANAVEIILAFTPRREGDFTSLYIEDQLKPLQGQGLQIKTTRLGRGLSSGAELEYADEETLKNALEGRR